MKRVRLRFLLLVLSAGLVGGFGGSCLPANFFADLAGDVIGTTVNTMVSELLDALLNPASAG